MIIFFLVIFLMYLNAQLQKLKDELAKAGLLYFENGAVENWNPDLGIEEQAELLPYDKKWEFPREKLKLGKVFILITRIFIYIDYCLEIN